jgi:hypothetical protein
MLFRISHHHSQKSNGFLNHPEELKLLRNHSNIVTGETTLESPILNKRPINLPTTTRSSTNISRPKRTNILNKPIKCPSPIITPPPVPPRRRLHIDTEAPIRPPTRQASLLTQSLQPPKLIYSSDVQHIIRPTTPQQRFTQFNIHQRSPPSLPPAPHRRMLSDSNTCTLESQIQQITPLTTPTTPRSLAGSQRGRIPSSQRNKFMWNGCDVYPIPNTLHYDVLRARTLDNSHFSEKYPRPQKHSKSFSSIRRSKRRAKSKSVFYDVD